jgi:hypothetical protein
MHRALGELEQARNCLDEAAHLFSALGDASAHVPRLNLALVLLAQGDDTGAWTLLESAVDAFNEQGRAPLASLAHGLALPLLAHQRSDRRWSRSLTAARSALSAATARDIGWTASLAARRSQEIGRDDRASAAEALAKDAAARLHPD